ncbi:MAG TPA: hypothetical protein VMV51_11760, partial [Gemmatimonadaceae bacterium]|nr:hypothetical protein [Gemmatimonadaceae bacterium]
LRRNATSTARRYAWPEIVRRVLLPRLAAMVPLPDPAPRTVAPAPERPPVPVSVPLRAPVPAVRVPRVAARTAAAG